MLLPTFDTKNILRKKNIFKKKKFNIVENFKVKVSN